MVAGGGGGVKGKICGFLLDVGGEAGYNGDERRRTRRIWLGSFGNQG